MMHVVLLNVVLFILPVCGATAFALLVTRHFLRQQAPPSADGPGGSKVPALPIGPDDLARSA